MVALGHKLSLWKFTMGGVSLVLPPATFFARSSPVGPIEDAGWLLFLISPGAIYLLGVRSAKGVLYFGPPIVFLVSLTALVGAFAGPYEALGVGLTIIGNGLTALIVAICAAAVDRVLLSKTNDVAIVASGYPSSAGQTETAPPLQSYASATTGQASDKRAIASLTLGIAGVVFLPIVLSIPAIVVGKSALRRIALSDGELAGSELARSGIVMGWVGVILGVPIALLLFTTLAS